MPYKRRKKKLGTSDAPMTRVIDRNNNNRIGNPPPPPPTPQKLLWVK